MLDDLLAGALDIPGYLNDVGMSAVAWMPGNILIVAIADGSLVRVPVDRPAQAAKVQLSNGLKTITAGSVYATTPALTRGNHGLVCYVTDNIPRPARELFTPLLATRGIDVSGASSVPRAIASPIATLMQTAAEVRRSATAPPLTQWIVSFLGVDRSYDITRAQTELGYAPVTTVDEGLRRMPTLQCRGRRALTRGGPPARWKEPRPPGEEAGTRRPEPVAHHRIAGPGHGRRVRWYESAAGRWACRGEKSANPLVGAGPPFRALGRP